MPLVYIALALLTVYSVLRSGIYPSGVDTLCHIYKGDMLYEAIGRGDLWPSYDALWYNGVEMLRYWAPLPVYILAAAEALAGGDPIGGYFIFTGLIVFFYGIGWLYAGMKRGRPYLGAFIGLIWFFMPANLMAFFEEGNLPRCIAIAMLPFLLTHIYDYFEEEKWQKLPMISVLFALITLCHSGYAGMAALALLLCFAIRILSGLEWRRTGPVIAALFLGYLLTGLWLVPSLIGGLVSTDSSEIMLDFFQSLFTTLNPFYRVENGPYYFYYGLIMLMIAVFAFLFGPAEARPLSLSSIIIVLATSISAYTVLSKLPGGQFLWMLRFLSIALMFCFFALIMWKRLRKPVLMLLLALVVFDTIPSLPMVYGKMDGKTAEETMAEYSEWTLIAKAKEITEQRLSLVDESILDAMSPYLVTGYGERVPMTQGAAWQSASTAENFKQIDRALEQGEYFYLFDRSKELGDDTVLIRVDRVKELKKSPVEKMDAAAMASGYELIEENGLYRLYKLKGVSGSWGTKTKYRALGIGSYSRSLALSFPAIKETEKTNLNDFSMEELSGYDIIYLASFEYDDKEEAENMLLTLSRNGTRVIISADGIPMDRSSHERSFLGVYANDIVFSNGFPDFESEIGIISPDFFPNGYSSWQTVYLEGLDKSRGKLYDNGFELDFYGSKDNDELIFIGLNLPHFYGLTHDASVGRLLRTALNLRGEELPERKTVPLKLGFSGDTVTVESPESGVNTALAYHDSFVSESTLGNENNLTIVEEGKSVIKIGYPYFPQAALLSLSSALILILYTRYKRNETRRKEAENGQTDKSA